MISNNLPQWCKSQIQGYLKTGELKGGDKIPQSTAEMKPNADEFIAQNDWFVANDNNPAEDSDPRPNHVAGATPYLGNFTGEIEKSEDGKSVETYRHYGAGSGGNEAVIYTKSSPESFDQVVLTKDKGPDDSALHYTPNDPNGSFFILMDA